MSGGRRPRVVATDCDGTLLRTDGTVTDYTRGVLHDVRAAGVGVVLVTARPPRWMDELADLGVEGLALCGNGAFTYDLSSRRIVSHRLLEAEVLGELIADLRDGIPGIRLATEGLEGLAREHAYRGSRVHGPEWMVCEAEELAGRSVGKVLVRHEVMETEELTAMVAAIVGERAEVSHSGAVRLAEIGPRGVTKAVALAQWCDEQEPEITASDVWAFGDMPNDLPMLTWAGRSFAVANAHADVRAAADEVVASNDEDGVARTLVRLLEDG
ncbi:HAD family hydrolase [Ornithinimicrobium tianjinense]|uniref:HAD family hydrolase n=1 Tax=Ornithinimicrobium tianjinense TaxID=1195761 RepID=UPI0016640034|nr:HAD-IIB family hydrolase [Ornithinimicrobium tianjinense]